MAPLTIEQAIAGFGVEAIPIPRRPRLSTVGRHPFPVLDLRTRYDDGFSTHFDDKFQWVRDLYASDLPLRDFTLLRAKNVVVLRGSAHCHNTAGTRHRLWDRVLSWAGALDHRAT